MPGSRWAEHRVLGPPGSPKVGSFSHTSGWSQRLPMTLTMPGSLWVPHRLGTLAPGSPKLGHLLQPPGKPHFRLDTLCMPGTLCVAHRLAVSPGRP